MASLTQLEFVDRIVEYQQDEADRSVILKDGYGIGPMRIHYLENMRDAWIWVGSSSKGRPYALLRKK